MPLLKFIMVPSSQEATNSQFSSSFSLDLDSQLAGYYQFPVFQIVVYTIPKSRGIDDPMEIAIEEEVQTPPAPLPQLDMLRNFDNPLRANNWVRFHNRSLVTDRSVSLEENNKQRALLVDYLTGLRWDSLVELPEVVYPHAVRLFYNNMTVRHRKSGPVISSYVLGKEFKLDRKIIEDGP